MSVWIEMSEEEVAKKWLMANGYYAVKCAAMDRLVALQDKDAPLVVFDAVNRRYIQHRLVPPKPMCVTRKPEAIF